MVIPKKASLDITSLKPAAKPGLHSSTNSISKEYSQSTVKKRTNFLISSINWDYKKIKNYQLKETKKLLINAYENVPFYRKNFKKINFDPFSFSNLKEIKKIPIINKEIILKNHSDFVAKNANLKSLNYMTTGGSTGNPLKIIMNPEIRSLAHANTHFYMKIAGFELNKEKSIRLHGNQIDERLINKNQFWYLENNRLIMSVYHISEKTCLSYMEAIDNFKPKYIHSYPSAIFLLTILVKKYGYKFPKSLKAIFCDSETLYPKQKKVIEEYCNVQVFNTYGHTEGAVMGVTFPNSNCIELIPQIGLTEIVDNSGNNLIKNGQQGKIVVTGFNNYVFPLIRYDTKDIGVIGSKNHSNNIKYLTLEKIVGRTQDYLISKQNEIVPAAPLLFDYNFDWSGVQQFQLCQKTPGSIIVKIVKDINSKTTQKKILSRFNEILKNRFDIKVSIVKEIKKTKIGKFRYVHQSLKIDNYL